jgi:ankyrin repeat protein
MELIQALVTEGGNTFDINERDSSSAAFEKCTALMCATNYGQFGVVKYLVSNGADVNMADSVSSVDIGCNCYFKLIYQ